MTGMWHRVAGLEVEIESVGLESLQLDLGAWTRPTTVVVLRGGGHCGEGEDVTWDPGAQGAFQERGPDALGALRGRMSLAELSDRVDGLDLHPVDLPDTPQRLYRRWGIESAALSLALAQAGTDLGASLGREPRPVNYVYSMGLGDEPSTEPLRRALVRDPGARFKLDYSAAWTPTLVAELAELDCVDVVDLKGLYRGAFRGPDADAAGYAAVADGLPRCWIEDPDLSDAGAAAVLQPHLARVTWDANLHSLADLVALPVEPRCVNIKPSRFGMLSELLHVYTYCEARGIAMYGGGQFELGVGRRHVQALASLFHPTAANDVAPVEFHAANPPEDAPVSPISAPRFA